MNRHLLSLNESDYKTVVPTKIRGRKRKKDAINTGNNKEPKKDGASMSINEIIDKLEKDIEAGLKSKKRIKREISDLFSDRWTKYKTNHEY